MSWVYFQDVAEVEAKLGFILSILVIRFILPILVINAVLWKPSLKSCSKTEFCGKQILSECKVEMGQQTSRRSSSNLKMQNPGLKMQNGVELRNWFYLHLLQRRLTLRGKHTLKEDSSILSSCSHYRNICEANKELLKGRTTWGWRGCLVLINGRLEACEISPVQLFIFMISLTPLYNMSMCQEVSAWIWKFGTQITPS